MNNEEFPECRDIIEEMELVYKHDNRPWMIGFSGGKDSTLLCCLVFEMLMQCMLFRPILWLKILLLGIICMIYPKE